MLELKPLRTQDHAIVISSVLHGMHLHKYIKNPLIRNLHARSFFYEELARATHVLAAYEGDEFAGLMLVHLNGHSTIEVPRWHKAFIAAVKPLEKLENGISAYSATNSEILSEFTRTTQPDGEILLLAANPFNGIRGAGSFLLQKLAEIADDKQLYLFTDEGCTYEFYDHKGFDRVGEQTMHFEMNDRPAQFECYLYSKTFHPEN